MSKPQKGKNLMLSVGDQIYGFATSCDIDMQVDTKEISSGSYKHSTASGQWKEYDTERTGWTVNSDHLVSVGLADEQAIFDLMTAGVPVSVSFEEVKPKTTNPGETGGIEKETTRKGWQGSAIITSLKISAQDGSDATYSVGLQGTGPLSKITAAV